jgi:hypothetical protein
MSRQLDIPETELAAAYDVIAGLVYRAVRAGGVPCSTLPWRWGYGWPKCFLARDKGAP